MQSLLSKVTYHAVYDDSILAAMEYARTNGFAGVQVAIETPHLSFDRLGEMDALKIANLRTANRQMISLHGPDDAASLFQTDRDLLRGIFDYWGKVFSYAEIMGAQIITFHAGGPVRYGTDTTPRLMIPEIDEAAYRHAFRENLQRFVELAAGRFTLCLENYKLDSMIWEVVSDYLHAGAVHLCWDIAKTFRSPGEIDEELEAFFWKNLQFIAQVHLHDFDCNYSHKVIGSGNIDFMHFLPRLAQASAKEFCIEVRPREKALESLQRLREMVQWDR